MQHARTPPANEFIADMENPALPPPVNNRILRVNSVIQRWEQKIANGEVDDTEYDFQAPPTLTRQNAMNYTHQYSDKQ